MREEQHRYIEFFFFFPLYSYVRHHDVVIFDIGIDTYLYFACARIYYVVILSPSFVWYILFSLWDISLCHYIYWCEIVPIISRLLFSFLLLLFSIIHSACVFVISVFHILRNPIYSYLVFSSLVESQDMRVVNEGRSASKKNSNWFSDNFCLHNLQIWAVSFWISTYSSGRNVKSTQKSSENVDFTLFYLRPNKIQILVQLVIKILAS